MKVKGRGRTTRREAGKMNNLERDYAAALEGARIAGQIARWDFEPEALRLADRTFYHPDFRVLRVDGTVEFHEVKGFWEDDARVKIKVAAEMHPYVFVGVKRAPKRDGGGWINEVF